MDYLEGFFITIAIILVLILMVMLGNIIINQDDAKKCVKNGGEPYYFLTGFECKNNINVNLEGNDK